MYEYYFIRNKSQTLLAERNGKGKNFGRCSTYKVLSVERHIVSLYGIFYLVKQWKQRFRRLARVVFCLFGVLFSHYTDKRA